MPPPSYPRCCCCPGRSCCRSLRCGCHGSGCRVWWLALGCHLLCSGLVVGRLVSASSCVTFQQIKHFVMSKGMQFGTKYLTVEKWHEHSVQRNTWQRTCISCFVMFRWVCEHMQHPHGKKKKKKKKSQSYHTRCGSFLQVQQGDDSFVQRSRSYLCLSFRNLTPKINPHTCLHHKKTTQIPFDDSHSAPAHI